MPRPRPDPLARITAITERIAELDHEREAAIRQAIDAGATWATVAAALGVSTQAAHKRFRWLRHSPINGETWYEPPLPTGWPTKR